ncbi:zinc transport system substrate-binding protein [Primorskyibacter sedentarius]|uniref:High-affinity zinc uptake system protein ZnuA n=1 Tax=Primorskyibacter sedentarius TaxID=745311 RepID=A0A4R3JJY5_9RHOB|nr:zinc ABC transporter substrate-binding protein [Primorskyibacter sedentarius]TCS66573.1 zinc transport system substrate-binding protein [Primorskyibacter sedentarius]
MSRNLAPLSLAASLLAGMAVADAPNVAVDIAPVHSLVTRVMGDLGEPSLIVAPGASPHEYSLRPSEAAALQNADLVFWVGHDLTPWLEDAVDTLASDATVVELIEADGTTELPVREGALFDAHEHGDAERDGESHAGHDEDHDSAHEEDEHAGHDHGGHDPHAWLSVENGAAWLNAIAAALSADDPDNAGTYYANAAAGREELAALRSEINGILDPVRGRKFVVFHDAYQYFELDFDFPASGAISVSDATDPSPARIAEIQHRIADQGVTCIMSEPQFNPGIVAAVMDGSDARTGVMDPLGSDLEPGAALYPQLLRNLATSLADCL